MEKLVELKKRRSKGAFSLLELIVCLGILCSISAVLGVKGYALISSHRFQTSSHALLVEIQRWKVLSLVHNCDISISILKEQGEYVVHYKTEFPIPGNPSHTSLPLTGTTKLLFEGKPISSFQGTILSSGRLSLQGLLTLLPKDETEALSIDLGYPRHLKKGSDFTRKNPSIKAPPFPERKKEHLSSVF